MISGEKAHWLEYGFVIHFPLFENVKEYRFQILRIWIYVERVFAKTMVVVHAISILLQMQVSNELRYLDIKGLAFL